MANQNNEGDPKMEAIVRPCTPAESLEQSLQEMKAMIQGKVKKRTWKEFRAELKKSDE